MGKNREKKIKREKKGIREENGKIKQRKGRGEENW